MNDEKTTNQVTPPQLRNPTGKGGFGDNPENRSDGRWSKENSFSYWYNYFKAMTVKEFKHYERTHGDDNMTVAESLALVRVTKSRSDLREFQEVADRSEGKAQQKIEIKNDYSDLTDEQLQKIAGAYEQATDEPTN